MSSPSCCVYLLEIGAQPWYWLDEECGTSRSSSYWNQQPITHLDRVCVYGCLFLSAFFWVWLKIVQGRHLGCIQHGNESFYRFLFKRGLFTTLYV